MRIIKLDATESTNQYLKEMAMKKQLEDFTVVSCTHQQKGRGQMGNTWTSEKGKNLTVSVLKHFSDLDVSKVFYLNQAVSLAILKVLRNLAIPGVKVKWPNDIMSGNQKICGILIETLLKANRLRSCIIGFGLNVNQTEFGVLEKASSMKNITGQYYDLEPLLDQILDQLEQYLKFTTASGGQQQLRKEYESALFQKDALSLFSPTVGERFQGRILGVSEAGRLMVVKQDGVLTSFDNKEVQLIY